MSTTTTTSSYERQCVREVIARLKRRARAPDDENDDAEASRAHKVMKFEHLKRTVARDVARARRRATMAKRVGDVRAACDDVDDDCVVDVYDDDDEFAGVSKEDVEGALVAMQDALERALVEEERERIQAAAEAYDDNDALIHAIDAFERWNCDVTNDDANGEDKDVLCPACSTRKVLANRHVLFCACGDFRLVRRDENVGLRYLKTQLAAVFDAHAVRVPACERGGAGLKFHVCDEFGIDALYARCDACEFLEVVM